MASLISLQKKVAEIKQRIMPRNMEKPRLQVILSNKLIKDWSQVMQRGSERSTLEVHVE
jgi:hypothetical protein